MKNLVNFRHDRGFFIYAEPSPKPEIPWFFLGHRALDEQRTITAISVSPEGGCLTLSSQVVVHYCPQCGAKLADFYRDSYDQFFDPTLNKLSKSNKLSTQEPQS